jgi:hypothetical protein
MALTDLDWKEFASHGKVGVIEAMITTRYQIGTIFEAPISERAGD